jgi:hypothetical protein
MTLTNLFKQIESARFASEINIASGFRVFWRALTENEITCLLVHHLRRHPEQVQEVYQRLLNLLGANDQPEYAHPYDPALASYLYALSVTDIELASLAARQVLKTPRLWWSVKLAKQFLEGFEKTGEKWVPLGQKASPKVILSSRDKAISYAIHVAGPRPLGMQLSFVTYSLSSSRDVGQRAKMEVDYGTVTGSATYHQIGRMAG